MADKSWTVELFQSIDNKDTDSFIAFLSDDVFFRFGNAEPVHGKNNVCNGVKGFFESVKDLQHDVSETWAIDNSVICHGFVTYTRHDGSKLNVPFANVFKLEKQLIKEYLIYVDISKLYQ